MLTIHLPTVLPRYPQVYAIGLDEFLWLLRLWSGIVAFYLGRDWRRGQAPSVTTAPPPRPGAKAAAEAAAKASAKAAADRAAAEAAAKAAARAAKAAAKAAGSKPAAAGAAEPAGKEAAGEAAAEPRATQGQVVGYVTEEPFGEVGGAHGKRWENGMGEHVEVYCR
jgi:hypothetical protein